MANPVMPNGFVPTVAAYSHGGPEGVLRTEVAGGAARYALDYDRGLQKFNVTLILDKLQFSAWIAFFMHIIKKGAITFDMPLDSGFGTEQHACNIIPGSYSASRTGGIAMIVSFVVEAESQAYVFSVVDAQGMIDVYNAAGSDANALLARIAQFALVDSLALAFAAPVYIGPTEYLDFLANTYRAGDWLPSTTFAALITHTRASTATRIGPTGLIETVAANAPQFDFDPVTLAAKGMLIEEARTNLLTFSEQFDNAAWTKSASAVSANAGTAPNGTVTADRLIPTATSGGHSTSKSGNSAIVGDIWTSSVFAKRDTGVKYLRLAFSALVFPTGSAYYDLDAGIVSNVGAGSVATVQELADGWWRCSLTATCTAAGASSAIIYSYEVVGTAYSGDSVSGQLIWGAQLELGPQCTSYIPTTTAAATRAASDTTLAAQNRTVGTIIIEHDAPAGRVLLGDGAATVITSTGPGKIALAYDTAGSLLCANGGTVTTGAAVSLGATLRLLGNATVRANAHIKQYAEHPRKLSAAELQTATL